MHFSPYSTLAGLVSWGVGCGEVFPGTDILASGIYANVYTKATAKWIKETKDELNGKENEKTTTETMLTTSNLFRHFKDIRIISYTYQIYQN